MDRQRARFASERLEQEEHPESPSTTGRPATDTDTIVADTAMTSSTVGETSSSNNSNSRNNNDGVVSRSVNNIEEVPLGSDDVDEEEEDVADAEGRVQRIMAVRASNTMTLAELEEERELARRRSSACVLIGVSALFRLWIEAINNGDFILLMLCLMGTSWMARWIRHNREQEEELDRRIANYQNENSTTEIDRNDLRMLSFQAQLALAIMESQRQIMEGGHGHPDGSHTSRGVSEATQSSWKRFTYKSDPTPKKNGYGSVGQEGPAKGSEEAPNCSICLGEYEDGETLVQLPCGHTYHEECITSWTENHTKCPLCNFELESSPNRSGEVEVV